MSKFELKLPKMGESVAEATITTWLKEVGDTVELDEAIVEIATDKVDTEIPCEVEGVLVERLFEVDDIVGVGQVIAIIEIKGEITPTNGLEEILESEEAHDEAPTVESVKAKGKKAKEITSKMLSPSGKFYSPLVKNIAKTEGVSIDELEAIVGTGKDKRVTKNDILTYIENRSSSTTKVTDKSKDNIPVSQARIEKPISKTPVSVKGEDEIIEMTRIGKLIAKHMVESKQTSAHVQRPMYKVLLKLMLLKL